MLNIVEEYIFFKDGRELQEKVYQERLPSRKSHCVIVSILEREKESEEGLVQDEL